MAKLHIIQNLAITFLAAIIVFNFGYFLSSSYSKPTSQSCPTQTPRYAWASIANGNSYSKAALILGYSLKRANTKHELVLITSDEETKETKPRFELLRRVWDRIIFVKPISLKFYRKEEVEDDYESRIPAFFLKLRILELSEYGKICILGTDYVILKNIDKVFGCPAPCGVFDTWVWDTNSQSPTINGDMMILKPSLLDRNNMVELVSKIPVVDLSSLKDEDGRWIGPYDQGLFGYYYGPNWTALSYDLGGIEFQPCILNRPYLWQTERIHAIHYAQSRPKPWEVGNVSLNYAWENSIFREAFEMYKVIEIEFTKTLDARLMPLYTSLSVIEWDSVCDAEVCVDSKPLRDAKETNSLPFELKYNVKRWKVLLDVFQYHLLHPSNPGKYMAKLRIKQCEDKIKFFEQKLREIGE